MPAPSLGLINAGGANALHQLLARRVAAQVAAEQEQYQRALDDRKLSEAERRNRALEGFDERGVKLKETIEPAKLKLDNELGHGNLVVAQRHAGVAEGGLKLRGDELSQKITEWTDMKPQREANVGHTTAQTGDITRKPQAELAGREHDVKMQGLRLGGSLQEIAARAREERTTNAAKPYVNKTDPATLDAIASQLINNPDLIKDYPVKERGEILKHMAVTARNMPNRAVEASLQMTSDALTALETMKTHPGREGAVGAKNISSLFGLLSEPISGTDEAGFVAQEGALKARLTFPKLTVMRGLGAMSNIEFGTIQQASTALSRKMPSEDYSVELGVIEQNLRTVMDRLNKGQLAPDFQGGVEPTATGGSRTGGPGPTPEPWKLVNGVWVQGR